MVPLLVCRTVATCRRRRRYGTRVRVSGLSQVSEIEAAEKERMKAKARTRRATCTRRAARTRLAARTRPFVAEAKRSGVVQAAQGSGSVRQA